MRFFTIVWALCVLISLQAKEPTQQERNELAAKLIPIYMLLLDDSVTPVAKDTSIKVGEPFSQRISTSLSNPMFSLVGAPLGMTIGANTGEITWTPTPNQEGNVSFDINISGEIQAMTLHVNSGNFDGNKTVFLSPDALVGTLNSHPEGNYADPMRNTKWVCRDKPTMPDYHFYFRGGTYYNQGYGTNNAKTDPDFYCSGTKGHPIVIRPWGNERVKLKFDTNAGFKIDANYVTLENIEIEGVAQDINYTSAIKHWWNDTKYYNGLGLILNGKGLTIRNNVIHDVPGGGMNVRSGGTVDDLRIEENIVFNASWWNIAGTTAIGLVNFNKPNGADSNGTAHVVVKNNLVFASESRIFSRVYSKGFSHLSLDEGSSMLIKNDKNTTYDLGFLIEGNFFLFNGKGISIRWDKTAFSHNTLYNNGTTIEGNGAGFRSNGGKGIVIENNAAAVTLKAMESESVMNIIDFSSSAEVTRCDNNLFEGAVSLLDTQKCNNPSNTITDNIFTDPENLDFHTIEADRGAPMQTLQRLKAKVEELGYKVAPANYMLEINGAMYPVKSREYYEHQQADIIKQVKKLDSFESITGPGNFRFKQKDIYGYKINFSDKSVTGGKIFYLEIPH